MNLTYVLFPIAAFLVLAGPLFLMFRKGDSESEWRGPIGDLDLVVAILGTANIGARHLRLSVSRRVTYLLVDFEAQAAIVTLPIVTARQRKHKDDLFELMARSREDGSVQEDKSEQSSYSVRLEGEPEQIAERLKDLFLKVFDVDSNRVLEYSVQSHWLDLVELSHWKSGATEASCEKAPIAATTDRAVNAMAKSRRDLFSLARFFLVPIPFLLAYGWFDIFVASIVALVMLGGRIVFKLIKRGWTLGPLMATTNWIVLLGGCALTVYFREPYMLQLVPTVLCGVWAIGAVFPLFRGRTAFDVDAPGVQNWKLRDRLFFTFAVVVTCTIGVSVNEYLRANASLDYWVWYFAYFRLELLLGLVVTTLPISIWVQSRGANDPVGTQAR